ncbi:MAG: hypothetical protein IJC66_01305, partial [Kiritimatiellae bacterium]|nr:hypothetical protein [Kiritimatiellia bacterium]
MEKTTKQAMIHSLPFAVWMGLMFVLPTTAESYAIRSAATLATGIACWIAHRRDRTAAPQEVGICAGNVCASAISGILVGLAIFALWIWAPAWPYSEPVAPEGLPYAPQTCGWPLTIAKLVGSASKAPATDIFHNGHLHIQRKHTAEMIRRKS